MVKKSARRTRRTHGPAFKARVALAALREDNVFVERLWRSVKYERVYLKANDSVSAARADIAAYLSWYNAGRAHSSLDQVTPDEHCVANLPHLKQAA